MKHRLQLIFIFGPHGNSDEHPQTILSLCIYYSHICSLPRIHCKKRVRDWEYLSLQKLRHENLVNMIEVFRRKKRFFLVFEYLEHTILEELEARTGGGLGFATSRKYIYQVLRALDFIHSNNVRITLFFYLCL